MEQEFKMVQIETALRKPEVEREDIITLFLALQKQNLVLGNNIKQLLTLWPTSPLPITPEDL